jgi:hypothetical protein
VVKDEPSLEHVDLPVRHVLEELNKPVKQVFFLENGLASVIATNTHRQLEVGLIGRDGMTGIARCLGAETTRSPKNNSRRSNVDTKMKKLKPHKDMTGKRQPNAGRSAPNLGQRGS